MVGPEERERRERGQRRERQVGGQVQVVGQRDAELARTQAGDQIGLPGLDHLQAHRRVTLAKALSQPRRDQRRERDQATEVQRPAQLGGQLGGEALQLVRVAQQRAGAIEELAALGGRRDALRVVADEQLHAERGLELRDRRRHRRLRHGDVQGGVGDAAGLRRGDEVLQLAQREAHGGHGRRVSHLAR